MILYAFFNILLSKLHLVVESLLAAKERSLNFRLLSLVVVPLTVTSLASDRDTDQG